VPFRRAWIQAEFSCIRSHIRADRDPEGCPDANLLARLQGGGNPAGGTRASRIDFVMRLRFSLS